MKADLIDKLFDEFNKDQERIKQNLLQFIDVIHLTSEDEYNTIQLTIKIENKASKK